MSNDVHMTVWRKDLQDVFHEYTVHLEEGVKGEVCIVLNRGGPDDDEEVYARVFEIGELIDVLEG